LSADVVEQLRRISNGLLTPFVKIRIENPEAKLPLDRVFVSPLGESQLAAHAAKLCLMAAKYPNAGEIVQPPDFTLRF